MSSGCNGTELKTKRQSQQYFLAGASSGAEPFTLTIHHKQLNN
jgi:hypothetical protein